MKPTIEHIDIAAEEFDQLLERAREALPEEDYRKLKAALETLEYLTELVADKDTTIRHLRQLLLPASEKTKAVLEKIGIEPAADTPKGPTAENEPPAKTVGPRPGHGRNSAAEFTGAHRVEVPHQQLHHGDRCPDAGKAMFTARRSRRCWCGLSDKRPWRLRSTRWSGCAAMAAARCLRRRNRKESGPRSTTKQPGR